MRMITKFLAGGAGLAAIASAAPAAAQYGYGYAYGNPYGYAPAYGYNTYNPYAAVTQSAAQRCSAAVQSRLQTRQGLTGVIASLLGAPTVTPRVVSITQVTPRRSTVRVHGLASTGRFAGYGPYGVGAYGAMSYAYQPDLRFACTVDYNGYIRDIDVYRR